MRPLPLALLALAAACGEAPQAPDTAPTADAAASPLCTPHGVQTDVCPRCNPALAPVFQARGDWCDEHGFPESFCPVCAPEAGGRPPTAPRSVGARDGARVRLRSPAAAEEAGIAVALAEETPWQRGLTVVARVEWDPTRVGVAGASAAGVVSSVEVDVGDRVKAGQRLASLRSPDAAADRSRVVAARQHAIAAEAALVRARGLLESGATSSTDVIDAEQAWADAEADRLGLEATVDLLPGAGSALDVRAPLDGVVLARHVAVGQPVQASTALFDVVDPSRVWVVFDVPEAAIDGVHEGQPVRVVLDARPDAPLEGIVAALSPGLDPRTRALRGRATFPNPDGRLRANLLGRATLATDDTPSAVQVPAVAVQSADGRDVVFVRTGPDTFVVREVEVLERAGATARVAGGVRPGDPVVTTGAFLLKTEILSDRLGAGCCDVE